MRSNRVFWGEKKKYINSHSEFAVWRRSMSILIRTAAEIAHLHTRGREYKCSNVCTFARNPRLTGDTRCRSTDRENRMSRGRQVHRAFSLFTLLPIKAQRSDTLARHTHEYMYIHASARYHLCPLRTLWRNDASVVHRVRGKLCRWHLWAAHGRWENR